MFGVLLTSLWACLRLSNPTAARRKQEVGMLKAYRFVTVDCSEMPRKNFQAWRSDESDWTDARRGSSSTKLLVPLHDVHDIWYSQKY